MSHHDFNETPSIEKMKDILERAWKCGGDIAKFAAKANSPADTINLLRVTYEATKPVCMISMGNIGRQYAVIAPLYGSLLTYGAVGEAVAPGQLTIAELKRTMKVLLKKSICCIWRPHRTLIISYNAQRQHSKLWEWTVPTMHSE
jgi:3-dehydroquinate dehydratase-1